MSKALEAKHDKILKGLLRQPDNKRCINCETLVREGYVLQSAASQSIPQNHLLTKPLLK